MRFGRGLGKHIGRVSAAVAAGVFGYIAFMDLRDREARAAGREPKRVQRWVPYGRISPHLRRAVLVAEDAGFWGHEGIDLVEIRKALETDWEQGSFTRGAS